MLWKALDAHLRKANLSLLRWNSSSSFLSNASHVPATSTRTAWSITASTGICMYNPNGNMYRETETETETEIDEGAQNL
jgi:hypothetical protein